MLGDPDSGSEVWEAGTANIVAANFKAPREAFDVVQPPVFRGEAVRTCAGLPPRISDLPIFDKSGTSGSETFPSCRREEQASTPPMPGHTLLGLHNILPEANEVAAEQEENR